MSELAHLDVALCPKCDQETLLIVDTIGALLVIRCEACDHLEVTEAEREAA